MDKGTYGKLERYDNTMVVSQATILVQNLTV